MKHFEWGSRGALAPQLLDGEIVITSQAGVGIYDGDVQSEWQGGKLSLTSCRIAYESDEGKGDVLFLPLKQIKSLSTWMGFGSWSHSKIIAYMFDGSQHYKFSFRKGGSTNFHTNLTDMLQRKLWEGVEAAAKKKKEVAARHSDPKKEEFTTQRAGISGLIRKSESTGRSKQQELDDAMQDIGSVMSNVGALVSAIETLKLKGGKSQDDDQLLVSIESSLGLGSTVTAGKVGKGASLHLEIAKELNAWLTHRGNPLSRSVVIPLIELFSLYNRARGEKLLSPDDVLQGCECMSMLENPAFHLRRYRSGLFVLQKVGSSLQRELQEVLGPQPTDLPSSPQSLKPVTEASLANRLQVSAVVAKDILLDLEDDEVLCRSENTYGGLSFYWNIFNLA